MKPKKVICNRAKFIIVLAGDYNQFKRFLSEQKQLSTRFIYGSEREKLMGIMASDIIIYGTFWNRPDARMIYDEAKLCKLRAEKFSGVKRGKKT